MVATTHEAVHPAQMHRDACELLLAYGETENAIRSVTIPYDDFRVQIDDRTATFHREFIASPRVDPYFGQPDVSEHPDSREALEQVVKIKESLLTASRSMIKFTLSSEARTRQRVWVNFHGADTTATNWFGEMCQKTLGDKTVDDYVMLRVPIIKTIRNRQQYLFLSVPEWTPSLETIQTVLQESAQYLG